VLVVALAVALALLRVVALALLLRALALLLRVLALALVLLIVALGPVATPPMRFQSHLIGLGSHSVY
jgi:hypothetical protein